MKKEKEVAQKVYYYKLLEENLKTLIAMKESEENKLKLIKNAIEILKKLDYTDCLIPITDSLFVKAKILDKEKFLINVGHNVLLEKNLKQSIEFLENSEKEVSTNLQRLEREINQLYITYKSLEFDIRKRSEEIKKESG
ncbi:MAG: prefoldin subunit alpha [Candidatus Aenigmarchaeota archaeon]|nr:prefoldin subunit alpha [Candidatus Aenigmarchaeota archaeon]MDW8149441.1 prefoldin subunit alpha [Candidatus Aenigmarchaeota archaeon]